MPSPGFSLFAIYKPSKGHFSFPQSQFSSHPPFTFRSLYSYLPFPTLTSSGTMKFLATPLTTLVLCLGVLGATIQVRKPAGSSSSMLFHCSQATSYLSPHVIATKVSAKDKCPTAQVVTTQTINIGNGLSINRTTFACPDQSLRQASQTPPPASKQIPTNVVGKRDSIFAAFEKRNAVECRTPAPECQCGQDCEYLPSFFRISFPLASIKCSASNLLFSPCSVPALFYFLCLVTTKSKCLDADQLPRDLFIVSCSCQNVTAQAPASSDCAILIDSTQAISQAAGPTFLVQPDNFELVTFGTCALEWTNFGCDTLEYCWDELVRFPVCA